MTESHIVIQVAVGLGILALLVISGGQKRTRAKRLGVCALFAGVVVAILYKRFLTVPEIGFVQSYINRWEPSSLKEFFVLFLLNPLFLFFGWVIMVLGVSRLNTWKGLDPSNPSQNDDKDKSHKLGFDESDALGCILALPFLVIPFIEWGILAVGFFCLIIGFAGTARLVYSMIKIVL